MAIKEGTNARVFFGSSEGAMVEVPSAEFSFVTAFKPDIDPEYWPADWGIHRENNFTTFEGTFKLADGVRFYFHKGKRYCQHGIKAHTEDGRRVLFRDRWSTRPPRRAARRRHSRKVK